MPSEICKMRLASPKPCCGPMVSSVLRTIRSSVPCKTSFGILQENARTPLECQHEYSIRSGTLCLSWPQNDPLKNICQFSPTIRALLDGALLKQCVCERGIHRDADLPWNRPACSRARN